MSKGQLTVKGSSNRMLPQFQEPILGYVRLESRKHSMNLLPSTAFDTKI